MSKPRTKPSWRAATPTVRTVILWSVAFYALGLIVIFTLITRAGFTPQSMRWLIGLNVLALPFWVAFPIAGVRDHRRRKVQLADPAFHACLRCGYDLSAHADGAGGPERRCPECAEPFEPATNRAAWRKAFGLPIET